MTEAEEARSRANKAARYFHTYQSWQGRNRKVAEALGKGLFVLMNRALYLERKERNDAKQS